MVKFYLTRNDLLPVLPGNEQDLCHDSIDLVNTYFTKCGARCMTLSVLETSLPMYRSYDTLASDISAPNWCLNKIFVKDLIMISVTIQNTSSRQKCLELRCHEFYTLGGLVSKADKVMYLVHLVKQVSVDYVFMKKILLIAW